MPKSPTLFRSAPVRGFSGQVDRENRMIRGAVIMSAGPIKDGRPWDVDEDTLTQVVESMAAKPSGTKARFTHPSMSNDGFGKLLGRWTNPRIEDGRAVGDIKFSKSASNTPHGDLASYVMDLAEEDPSLFGVSIVADLADEMFDDSGDRMPLRIDAVRAADFVDDPAATDGLFSLDSASDLPAIVSHVISTHFAHASPEEVYQRLSAMLSRHYGRPIDMTTTETKPDAKPEVTPLSTTRDDAAPFISNFGDQGARWFLEGKSLTEAFSMSLAAARTEIAELTAEKEDLHTQLSAALSQLGEKEKLSQSLSPRNDKQSQLAEKVDASKRQGYSDATSRWAAGMSAIKGANN